MFLDALGEAFSLLFSGAVDVWGVILTSLRVSGLAVALGLLLGLPAGFLLGSRVFVGRRLLVLLVNTAMGFPPVVVGLMVYMLLSRSGPLGALELLYSTQAMVFAQVIIATPIIAGVSAAAVAAVPSELRLLARALGASRWQQAWLTMKEARFGVLAAVAAGFGGIISEVGAVMMVGGNISGETRVMTTAIVLETRQGHYGTAMALGLILLALALAVNVLLAWFQYSGVRYER